MLQKFQQFCRAVVCQQAHHLGLQAMGCCNHDKISSVASQPLLVKLKGNSKANRPDYSPYPPAAMPPFSRWRGAAGGMPPTAGKDQQHGIQPQSESFSRSIGCTALLQHIRACEASHLVQAVLQLPERGGVASDYKGQWHDLGEIPVWMQQQVQAGCITDAK